MEQGTVVDYTEEVGTLVTQGKGRHYLSLAKLREPFRAFDGKFANYELVYSELVYGCEHSQDEAWARRAYTEISYWREEEIPDLQKVLDGELTLFDIFRLFA